MWNQSTQLDWPVRDCEVEVVVVEEEAAALRLGHPCRLLRGHTPGDSGKPIHRVFALY